MINNMLLRIISLLQDYNISINEQDYNIGHFLTYNTTIIIP